MSLNNKPSFTSMTADNYAFYSRGMVISLENKPSFTSMGADNYAFYTQRDGYFFELKIELYDSEYE